MEIESEIKQLKDEEKTHHSGFSFCCLPDKSGGVAFCGIIFTVIGIVWLLNVLGVLVSGFGVLWPLLFICIGLFWLVCNQVGRS